MEEELEEQSGPKKRHLNVLYLFKSRKLDKLTPLPSPSSALSLSLTNCLSGRLFFRKRGHKCSYRSIEG